MATFADVLTIINGKNQSKVENPNGKYPIYGSGGIMGWADDYLCEAQTVVIGRKGSINKPIYVETPFWNVDTAFGLRANEELLAPKYLYYFCEYFDFEKLNTTVTIPSLTKANLLKIEINLPDLPTQRRIAATLDKVSEGIAVCRQMLADLDVMVKSQFVEMFSNRDYPIVKLSDIATVTSGLTKNSNRPNFPIKMPYLRVANVFFNQLDLSDVQEIGLQESEVKKTLLQKDDLLFVEGNGSPEQIGRVALWDGSIEPMSHQNHIIKARMKSDSMIPGFAMYYFMLPIGRAQILESAVSTSGLYTLSVGKISNFTLPMPPRSEQESFMAIAAQADKSKFVVRQQLAELETLKKSLMQEYFG